MPLFEAVINSITAIEESSRRPGRITIRVHRDAAQQELDVHGNTIAAVESFEIEDNGSGFTKENFGSFNTMDSRAKAARGGKGIGRLLWLKAFSQVHVDSAFEEDGKWWRRTFNFRLTNEGIEEHSLKELPAPTTPRTVVRLAGFANQYRQHAPKSAETIGRRVIEHCLEFFFLGRQPEMLIDDVGETTTVNLGDLFAAEYRPTGGSREFLAGEASFRLTDALLKASADAQHRVHFCANDRVVESVFLKGKIPHLDSTLLTDEGESAVYVGYVTGDFLNQRVDPERTSFSIDREGALGLAGGPTWEDLLSTTVATIREYLAPRTEEARRRALERIRGYVDNKAPRYRPLFTHRAEDIGRLSGSVSDSVLDLELHKMLNGWREEVRHTAREQLQAVELSPDSFSSHEQEYRRVLGDLQEVAKADLADYVVHRATVLSFFETLLGKQGDNRFAEEGALHGLVFPMRKTSDQVDYDEHSLWILDERLAYHKYLASDLRLDQQSESPVDVQSAKRPDILIFNRSMAFVPGAAPFSSVVVVEFKRPERDEYREDDNPIRQVIRYIQLIRDGKARRDDGSSIAVPDHAPFYCYVVATLTPRLKTEAAAFGFMTTPDGDGYFHYNNPLNAYIEVSSYRKILEDAKKRNRAFFDRLHLPCD